MTQPKCSRDDPFVPLYRIGGEPWRDQSGVLKRIYFNASPGLRGQVEWQRGNPGRSFPPGYFEVATKTWVSQHSGWTHQDYRDFMIAAVKRKTVAAELPQKEVFTRDGVPMQRGMVVMFVGGQIPGRPGWGTSKLENRLVIAASRIGSWYYGDTGRITSYGSMCVPVREHADHKHPRSWVVLPMREGEAFQIEGRNFMAEWSFLVVDATASLISVVREAMKRLGIGSYGYTLAQS
ncbi:MAG: hypothetical protein EPN61_15345 [Burkholderiaceae bacterium]|nr:MAG: hypothetical protein EPN61_15345 [Burkholderiaceae bacterium]